MHACVLVCAHFIMYTEAVVSGCVEIP
jgi:hypothetical protein